MVLYKRVSVQVDSCSFGPKFSNVLGQPGTLVVVCVRFREPRAAFSRKSVGTQGSLLVGSFAPRPCWVAHGGRSFPLDDYSGFSASGPPDITNIVVSERMSPQALET